jgi:signal recognition particle subunit SRP68
LRQVLGQTQSSASKPYQKKELPDEITDSRYLHLLLFQSERAWAYAMELKRESSSESRKHHHVVRRLRRAAQYALLLSEIAEKHSAEKRTQLDVKVGSTWAA